MKEIKVGQTVKVKDEYETITRELDEQRDYNEHGSVGVNSHLTCNTNRGEVTYFVKHIDSDGDVYLSDKEDEDHYIVVHKETLYDSGEPSRTNGIFIVTSVLYDDFNSQDEGLYFVTSYEAHKWINAKFEKLSPELNQSVSTVDIFVTELKSFN